MKKDLVKNGLEFPLKIFYIKNFESQGMVSSPGMPENQDSVVRVQYNSCQLSSFKGRMFPACDGALNRSIFCDRERRFVV